MSSKADTKVRLPQTCIDRICEAIHPIFRYEDKEGNLFIFIRSFDGSVGKLTLVVDKNLTTARRDAFQQ